MRNQYFLFLVGGIFSLIVAMGIGRFAYTPILPLMQNDLDFSNSMAGYLATSNYAGYLLGAIFTWIFPIKKHKTSYLRTSLIGSIITTFCMGLTHSYSLFLVFRFISGIFSAFIFVLASSIVLDKLAKDGKTNLSGIFYAGVGLGIFLTGLIIPSLNHSFHGEGVWIGLAVVSSLFTFIIWMTIKESPYNLKRENKKMEFIQLPPSKWFPWLVAAYGLEGLGYIVTGTFIVSIAEKTSTFSTDPSFIWMIVGIAAIPSCIIWSLLAKKFGYIKSLMIAMTLQSFGIALPVFWITPTSLVLSAIIFGATFMGITTLATTLARQMNPSNSNQAIGYMTAFYALGQMIGPTIAGVLSTFTQNYNAALIVAASTVFIGSCMLLSGIRFERSLYFIKMKM